MTFVPAGVEGNLRENWHAKGFGISTRPLRPPPTTCGRPEEQGKPHHLKEHVVHLLTFAAQVHTKWSSVKPPVIMARDQEAATPARPPPSLTKQSSIKTFFTRTPMAKKENNETLTPTQKVQQSNGGAKKATASWKSSSSRGVNGTPVPSSDAADPSSSQENENRRTSGNFKQTGLLSPSEPLGKSVIMTANLAYASPSRKVGTTTSVLIGY